MSDPMAEIRASFFIECEELLESLFDALQVLSDGQNDDETINIAFRAVHSIKGGAGAFALDDLVDFAHHFETVMDDLRSEKIDVEEALVELFFRCGDILSDLVKGARDGVSIDPQVVEPVVEALKALHPGDDDCGASGDALPEPAFQPLSLDLGNLELPSAPNGEPDIVGSDVVDQRAEDENPGGLKVVFRPEPELYESGNEPLFLLRNLADLGPTNTELELDSLEDSRPEAAPGGGLKWTVSIETDARRGAVEEIFEFVNGLCVLEITETQSSLEATISTPAVEETENSPFQNTQPTPTGLAPNMSEEHRKVGTVPEMTGATDRNAKKSQTANATVRVDIGRIDRLVNLVGELVINQSMLSQSLVAANLAPNSAVSNGLDEFLQLTRDIQESVMMIRAQPVKSLFQRMSRIVREASAAIDKKVALVTEGESTEIDKTVIERLADPLTHMIRNAVDHGLEVSEDRVRAGKSEIGSVHLSAMHRSGRVVIEISDDGGGINRPKVRRIAEEKGLISPDAQLSDADVDQLLFMPGFSTADQISNLSGRGVGMDVVKNAITALGGRITIQSLPGEGTTFSISLPLTLAVQDGMVVTVANETLVIPLNAIVETLTLKNDDIRRLGPRSNVVIVRETVVPLLDLGVELGYRAPLQDYGGAIALLVGQDDGSRAALMVDAIEDQRQVVIKGLQESYGHVAGVAAATILGDGQIALILDAADLVQNAVGHSRALNLKEVG